MVLKRIRNRADVKEGVDHLIALEPRFARVIEEAGYPPTRLRKGGFPALAHAIIGQQVSRASADAIWSRFCDAVDPQDPARYLSLTQDQIDTIGLSRPKKAYLLSLSEALVGGDISFPSLHRAPDEEVIRRLTALKGIGRWTADIYLLSAMGRPDAWPTGDLALQVAAQDLFGLPDRPTERVMVDLARDWSPLRAIAARLLWHDYAFRRKRAV